MVAITGLVGAQSYSDGSQASAGVDKTGALVTGNLRGRFAEAAARGLLFAASIPPGTGQAPGTSIGTTAAFTLANGATSTVNLVLLELHVGYISGTLGAGVLALLAHFVAGGTITAPSGGTVITPTNMGMGLSTASAANCRFNNTVPASGLMVRAICNLQASLATTAVAPWQIKDLVEGQVVVRPGQAVSVQGIAAAGSSPLITVAAVWMEETVVSGR
jgi:hypothetical protein